MKKTTSDPKAKAMDIIITKMVDIKMVAMFDSAREYNIVIKRDIARTLSIPEWCVVKSVVNDWQYFRKEWNL